MLPSSFVPYKRAPSRGQLWQLLVWSVEVSKSNFHFPSTNHEVTALHSPPLCVCRLSNILLYTYRTIFTTADSAAILVWWLSLSRVQNYRTRRTVIHSPFAQFLIFPDLCRP